MRSASTEMGIALAVGAGIGILCSSSGPGLPLSLIFCGLWGTLIYQWIGQGCEGETRLVQLVFAISLLVRLSMALLLHSFVKDAASLAGDDSGYEFVGRFLSMRWAGEVQNPPLFIVSHLDHIGLQGAYVYWNAIWFYLFGDVALLPKALNCIFGALIPVFMYRIAYRLYDKETARLALLLVAIMPSMNLWSSLNLRDAPATLAITASIYYTIRMKEGFSTGALVGLLISMLGVAVLRSYMFIILGAALAISFVGLRKGRELGDLMIGVLVTFVLLILFRQLGLAERPEIQNASLARIDAMRQGLAKGGSAYAVGADVSSLGGALLHLPIGITYLLFAPFPWQLSSFRQVLTFPEVLLFYVLFPGIVRGFLYVLRERLRDSLPVILPALLVTISYALVEGNVGTAYRHKSQVLGLFLILAALDLARQAQARQRVHS